MNSNVATEIIELLCTKLGIVFNWTGEEAWPYIQQLMVELANGKFYFHLTLTIALLICSIVVWFFVKRLWGGRDEDYFVSMATAIFIGIPLTIGSIVTTCYAVMWKTMPTIMAYKWILEALKD